jgi:hypothetical protein
VFYSGGQLEILPYDDMTDENGLIRFQAHADWAIAHPTGPVPGSPVEITATMYGELLGETLLLTCNTFDYNMNGVVDPIDFGIFAGDYGTTAEVSDFHWDGVVNPLDFGTFAAHWGCSDPTR